jgi:uncharacterized protein YlxW (UPF0749 family)
MDWGGPEFVLLIIAMATGAGIIKTAIKAKHGLPDRERGPRRHHRKAIEDNAEMQRLQAENRRLTDRLEASEDRLAVLERIVTDKSYMLASEIEALRDRAPAQNGRGDA